MSKAKIKTACVRMIANELKAAYRRADSINAWPVKCRHCGMIDIEFVPKPYLLTKDIPRQVSLLARFDISSLSPKKRGIARKSMTYENFR